MTMAGFFSFLASLWGILLLPGVGLLVAGKICKRRGLCIAGWIVCGVCLALLAATFVCAIFLIE